ncbi:MAG: hypothetical protein AAFO69_16325 [Bacteroidota bacterium]
MMQSQKTNIEYVWYNSIAGLYQKGSRQEFKYFLEVSGAKEEFSLIMKLSNRSSLLAKKVVEQLNLARQELVQESVLVLD